MNFQNKGKNIELSTFVHKLRFENKAAWRLLVNLLTCGTEKSNPESGFLNCRYIQLKHQLWYNITKGVRQKAFADICTLALTPQEIGNKASIAKHAYGPLEGRFYLFVWYDYKNRTFVTDEWIESKKCSANPATQYAMKNNLCEKLNLSSLSDLFNNSLGQNALENKHLYVVKLNDPLVNIIS